MNMNKIILGINVIVVSNYTIYCGKCCNSCKKPANNNNKSSNKKPTPQEINETTVNKILQSNKLYINTKLDTVEDPVIQDRYKKKSKGNFDNNEDITLEENNNRRKLFHLDDVIDITEIKELLVELIKNNKDVDNCTQTILEVFSKYVDKFTDTFFHEKLTDEIKDNIFLEFVINPKVGIKLKDYANILFHKEKMLIDLINLSNNINFFIDNHFCKRDVVQTNKDDPANAGKGYNDKTIFRDTDADHIVFSRLDKDLESLYSSFGVKLADNFGLEFKYMNSKNLPKTEEEQKEFKNSVIDAKISFLYNLSEKIIDNKNTANYFEQFKTKEKCNELLSQITENYIETFKDFEIPQEDYRIIINIQDAKKWWKSNFENVRCLIGMSKKAK